MLAEGITGGWQVLSLRQLDRGRTVFRNGHVLQPYHPLTKASELPVVPGEVMETYVEIFPTGAVVQPGHTLRLTLQAADVPEIARRAVRQFVDEVPFYRLLPRDVLDGEATDSAAAALGVFLRAVREGKAPSPEELTVSLNAAAHRAQEQVPLAAVLAAYHIAARVGWESLIEIAEPDEFDEVLAAGPHVLRYLQEIVPAVAGVYLEERQAIHGEERETRRALVSALLTGQPAGALAARAQVQVAGAYVLLRLRLKTTEEAAPTAGAAMTARRRVRQIQAVLDEFAGGPVLGTFDGHGGIALLPATPDTVDDVLSGLSDVVTKVRGSVDVDVVAGAAGAPDIASVPAAAAQASEIADLAAGLARPPGVYLLDDLVLEYQITRPGPARDRLVARLESLAEHEHMLDALRAWVAAGGIGVGAGLQQAACEIS